MDKIKKLIATFRRHHSRDPRLLARLRAEMDKPDPWRCRFRMRVVKGRSGQCGGCWRYWSQCNDSSYVHQQPRHPQHQHGGAYTTGWLARFRTVGFRKIQVTTETNSKPQTTCAEAATPKFQRRCEQGKRQGSQQGLCRTTLYIL